MSGVRKYGEFKDSGCFVSEPCYISQVVENKAHAILVYYDRYETAMAFGYDDISELASEWSKKAPEITTKRGTRLSFEEMYGRELEDIDTLMTGESYSFLPPAANGLVRKRIIVLKIK